MSLKPFRIYKQTFAFSSIKLNMKNHPNYDMFIMTESSSKADEKQ